MMHDDDGSWRPDSLQHSEGANSIECPPASIPDHCRFYPVIQVSQPNHTLTTFLVVAAYNGKKRTERCIDSENLVRVEPRI
jgi:hypothetical protein